MGLFDEIKGFAEGVGNKAKDVSDSVKINSVIAEEEQNLKNVYAEVGKMYFSLHAEEPEEPYRELIEQIKQIKERINEQKAAMLKIKGMRQCPHCGGDVAANAAFCPNCGGKLPTLAELGLACPNCGAQIKEGMKFCVSCGFKLETEQDSKEPAGLNQ